MGKFQEQMKAVGQIGKGANVKEMLLLANVMDKRKGEIYQDVAGIMHKEFPYSIAEKEGKLTFLYADGFPGITGYMSKQFDVWPQTEIIVEGGTKKVDTAFSSVATMKKENKLSEEQVTAYDSINRFSNWYAGFKMQVLREHKNEDFQAEVEAKKSELLATIPKKERTEEKLAGIERAATKAVRAAHAKAPNPRLFDMKGNVNEKQLKSLKSDQKAAAFVQLAKTDGDTIIEALKAAGRPVVPAKSISELRASTLIEQLAQRVTSGDFTNIGEAKKHIEALQKLLVANGVNAGTKVTKPSVKITTKSKRAA